MLYGLDPSLVASFDGKTMRGVHGTEVVRHILSLFSQGTHQILGQVGVSTKENEIPAFHRLLEQVQIHGVDGLLLLGDALHTQKETINDILGHHADYLLFVKGNQERLFQDLELFFSEVEDELEDVDIAKDYQLERGRAITTEVTSCSDLGFSDYLKDQGWEKTVVVGKLHRTGTREEIDNRTKTKVVKQIDETIYCISSRRLTAKQLLTAVRGHWSIENNLHWEKDYLFLEDRCTLRSGNAPQVMTFLKSMCLSLFNLWRLTSPTEAVSNFQKSTTIHHSFLRMSGVI